MTVLPFVSRPTLARVSRFHGHTLIRKVITGHIERTGTRRTAAILIPIISLHAIFTIWPVCIMSAFVALARQVVAVTRMPVALTWFTGADAREEVADTHEAGRTLLTRGSWEKIVRMWTYYECLNIYTFH